MSPQRTSLIQLADAPALAARGRDELARIAAAAIAERGSFRIALAGGSTPKLLYEALASAGDAFDFARWHVYFGDERNVPPDHADSNFRMASEAWLARGRVPEAQVHRMRGELEAARAALEYERELQVSFATREAPRFDLVLLGMGADGHTASLFPGSTALGESRAFVAATWVEKLSTHRITLTLRTLNAARAVLFLVAGPDKADALRGVFHGSGDPRALPARLVQPWDGGVTWLVDRAAAAKLRGD
jgi:6-phosphogluconolactonase